MLKITELEVRQVKPQGSLIGFCSLLIDNGIKLNNLAIHTRLQGGIRIVYPKANNQSTQSFYPVNKEVGRQIENLVYERCVNDGVLNGRHYQAEARP